MPVAGVQDEDEPRTPGSADWQLVEGLEPRAGEALVGKRYGDAFAETDLEDVLAALHLEVNDWATAAVLAAVADADQLPLTERAAAIFRAYAANVTSDPRRVRITFVEIIGVSARLEEQRLARRAHWVDLVCAEAQRAVARGEAAPRDFRIAATAFIGSVNGLLHDWNAGWVDATLDEVVEELVRQLVGILQPPGWDSGRG